MPREKPIELRSDDVQEILTQMPSWVVRWGITVIFSAIAILITASFVIKYPDIITARVVVTTPVPPVKVVAQSSGKIVSLLVKDNQIVKMGTTLLVIENPASLEDVKALRLQLNHFQGMMTQPELATDIHLEKYSALGELQADYSSFVQNFLEYQFAVRTNFAASKAASLNQQSLYYKDLADKFGQQKDLLVRDVELTRKKYENDKGLKANGYLSETELASSESAYLQKKYALQSVETNSLNNSIRLSETQKSILELRQQFSEKVYQLTVLMQESYKKLESRLDMWEQKYILKAPIDGSVSFFKFWSKNQFITSGEEVLAVVPPSSVLSGKAYLPRDGSGKVKPGQIVKLKFDSYPYYEFGTVDGRVESVAQVSKDNEYLTEISLPNGLHTNYNKKLDFKQEMQANGEIITEDLRLIDRVFYRFRYLIMSGGR
ncbi:MAG: HlyD family efflux transporter periplasmic adaptor subunit [Ignavibacteriae bacterium]|nr:HlyD family efflux transporter periplasmic adaptor subunit [Ignavibacteriota bacterium]